MATNPFYVNPMGGADIGGTLVGIGGLMQKKQQMEAEAAEREAEESRRVAGEQQTAQAKTEALQAYQSGDANKMAEVMIKYPDLQKQISAANKYRNEATRNNQAASMEAILRNPEKAGEILQARRAFQVSQNDDPTLTDAQIARLKDKGPEAYVQDVKIGYATNFPEKFKAYQQATGQVGEQGMASAKTEILDDGTVIQALPNQEVIVRNPAGEVVTGQARIDALNQARQSGLTTRQREADIAVDAETRKAAARAGVNLKAKPEIEGAVARAVSQVKGEEKAATEQKTNQQILQTYNIAMNNLSEALGETESGPVAGRLSLTAAQKTADGAIAAMAPVLKSIFRQAGEGTFTEGDQKLLIDMLPKRTDPPATRKAKIEMIDSIVQSKLGGTPQGGGDGGSADGSEPALPPTNAQGWELNVDANGNRAYVGPNGQVQEVP